MIKLASFVPSIIYDHIVNDATIYDIDRSKSKTNKDSILHGGPFRDANYKIEPWTDCNISVIYMMVPQKKENIMKTRRICLILFSFSFFVMKRNIKY